MSISEFPMSNLDITNFEQVEYVGKGVKRSHETNGCDDDFNMDYYNLKSENVMYNISEGSECSEGNDYNESSPCKKIKFEMHTLIETDPIHIKQFNISMYDISNPNIANNIESIEFKSTNKIGEMFAVWNKMMGYNWIKNWDSFAYFRNLACLKLTNLVMKTIPLNMNLFENLEHIDFSNIKITQIDSIPCLMQFPKYIKTINMSNIGLINVPINIYKLKYIEKLYLANNKIDNISDAIGQLKTLRELDISNNNISQLPFTFSFLKSLVHLYLSGNKIKCIDGAITNMHNLYHLKLDNCNISSISNSIYRLANLEILDLSNNNLDLLPNAFYKLKLKQLSLCNNNLTSLFTDDSYIPTLTHLSIKNNKLTMFNKNLYNLLDLELFDASNNDITEISDDFGNLTSLITLKLDSNQITSIPSSIGKLCNLRTVYLSNNKIQILPDVFESLKYLTRFTIANNELTTLPLNIINASNITYIDYFNNPIISMPELVARFIDNIVNPDKRLIFNDNQNVHNSTIQKSVVESISKLMKQPVVIDSKRIISQWLSDPILTVECKNIISNMYNSNNVQMTLNVSYQDVFEYVWATIHNMDFNLETQKEIKQLLNADIISHKDLCFTGHLTCIVNCLNGFSPLISIEISENENISNIIVYVKDMLIKHGDYSINKHKDLASKKLIDLGISQEVIDVWIENIE